MAFTERDIKELIDFGREQSGVEFKSPGTRDDPSLRGKVIRAMLAMANRRDGGTVIIGVTEDGPTLRLEGLTEDQATTWKHDTLADTAAEYADPRLAFHSSLISIDGHTLAVIRVQEFADVPVVCRRTLTHDKRAILRDGAVYVRSNRKPESREVANYDEMRELLDIATDKGVRRFVVRTQEAGLNVQGPGTVSSADAYKAERGNL